AALVPELARDLLQLVLEDLHAPIARCENGAKLLELPAHLGELFFQLLALETGELGETHVENRVRLPLRPLEPPLQLRARLGRVLRLPNELDNFVDVVDG